MNQVATVCKCEQKYTGTALDSVQKFLFRGRNFLSEILLTSHFITLYIIYVMKHSFTVRNLPYHIDSVER